MADTVDRRVVELTARARAQAQHRYRTGRILPDPALNGRGRVLFTVLCTCGEQTESLHEPDLEPWIARHVENNARVAAASALADLGQEGHE